MPLPLSEIRARNFRCFRDTGAISLKNVNILVGENSAGKTSLLALARILCNLSNNGSGQFNQVPFLLGSYDEIAFNIGGQKGREESFNLSCAFPFRDFFTQRKKGSRLKDEKVQLDVEFVNVQSQPSIRVAKWGWGSGKEATITVNGDTLTYKSTESDGDEIKFSLTGESRAIASTNDLLRHLRYTLQSKANKNSKSLDIHNLGMLESLTFFVRGAETYAATPIRSQPRRTYDPVTTESGSDANYALQSLASLKRTRQAEWTKLKSIFEQAGSTSGLFSGFDIRLLGKNESDPFQARVRIGSKKVNIIDVGFGVSQMIPVIYDLLAIRAPLVLVQQPETHLHPRAQAGLGDLISRLPGEKPNQQFIIETHSDYLIDAIRIAIREGRAKAEQFNLIFCEKDKNEARVHEIAMDSGGDLVEQPECYRRFFLNHQGRLFGLA